MQSFLADLHIHTCLSPCGDSRMIPPSIRKTAQEREIRLIAITDHHSADNVAAVADCCEPEIAVIGGLEITTAEEAHVLALCPDRESLYSLEAEIQQHLQGENDPDRFGPQYVVDRDGYVVDLNHRLLAGATDMSLEEIVTLIHAHNGLAVACHVDRPSYSIVSQLGFIPSELELDAVELSAAAPEDYQVPGGIDLPVLMSSDAHQPDRVGAVGTRITGVEASFAGLSSALAAAATLAPSTVGPVEPVR